MSTIGHLKKIAIVGATGRLGRYFVDELLKTGQHTITALTRGNSRDKLPADVNIAQVDYSSEESLVAALQGQEFLAIVLAASAPPNTHSFIVKAAAKAGVSYIMPTTYGADVANENMVRDEPYHQGALAKVKEIESLGLNHITMCCGFWYEWSLALGENAFGIDIKSKKAILFDYGATKLSVSTFRQCGRAFAALLSLPESGATPSLSDFKNKPFRFNSFCVSQRDMLDSVQRAQGTNDRDWDIKSEPSSKRVADGFTEMRQGNRLGFVKAMYSRAFYPSADADYEARHSTSNEILGLPQESLDDTTGELVKGLEDGTFSL
ncbi:NAD(P)-binding protein [Xylaria bambusicola]|uniref:NAD(P)-binding protein n=1 Tax=Xylaria bambusicola TaxID=326684 RepID=UPI002007BF57|nr:NAD(P)-binding protein [Xylaria bambusicola]KAI0512602.1 NAD(P)-binding protein [Xylaria bambusicola]